MTSLATGSPVDITDSAPEGVAPTSEERATGGPEQQALLTAVASLLFGPVVLLLVALAPAILAGIGIRALTGL